MFTLRINDQVRRVRGFRARCVAARSPVSVGAAVALAVLAAGCGGGSGSGAPASPTTTSAPTTAEAPASPGPTTTQQTRTQQTTTRQTRTRQTRTRQTRTRSSGGVVTRQQARQAALAHVGEGRVTYISREDDFGATWEVEVTRPNGSEVDVYVAADGRVVRTR